MGKINNGRTLSTAATVLLVDLAVASLYPSEAPAQFTIFGSLPGTSNPGTSFFTEFSFGFPLQDPAWHRPPFIFPAPQGSIFDLHGATLPPAGTEFPGADRSPAMAKRLPVDPLLEVERLQFLSGAAKVLPEVLELRENYKLLKEVEHDLRNLESGKATNVPVLGDIEVVLEIDRQIIADLSKLPKPVDPRTYFSSPISGVPHNEAEITEFLKHKDDFRVAKEARLAAMKEQALRLDAIEKQLDKARVIADKTLRSLAEHAPGAVYFMGAKGYDVIVLPYAINGLASDAARGYKALVVEVRRERKEIDAIGKDAWVYK